MELVDAANLHFIRRYKLAVNFLGKEIYFLSFV
jgi:hypothetical protein